MNEPLQVLVVGTPPPALDGSPWGAMRLQSCEGLDAATAVLQAAPADALLFLARDAQALAALRNWPALSACILDTALVAVAPALSREPGPDPDPELALDLLRHGVQDVLTGDEATPAALARALRLAVERKRLERDARKAYASDLATGLPNHAQLLEHMTQLLALREREPAPMALIVLRIEGLAGVEAELGVATASVLRRKVAVRLRAGLRASDVVAAIGTDAFAVLLAWIDASDAAPRVAAKLAQALAQPFVVAGQPRALAVAAGLASYPQHGRDAAALLRRATGQAAQRASVGRTGMAGRIERGPTAAANDE